MNKLTPLPDYAVRDWASILERTAQGSRAMTAPMHACPICGYWNHKDANVRDSDTEMTCNRCHHIFEVSE